MRRYTFLTVIPLAMLLLGFAALLAPTPYRGPLVVAQPLRPELALLSFSPAFYLADGVGILLLLGAVTLLWALGLLWERQRSHF